MGCFFSGTFSFIGFIVGLIFGGFGGALIGMAVGSIIDAIIGKKVIGNTSHYYETQDFTEHLLYLAAYVARADNNRLLRSEMTYVQDYFRQLVGSERLSALMLRFRDILDENADIGPICQDLNHHATINEKLVILNFLFGFSTADGEMRSEEVSAIWDISQRLGIPRSTFESIRSMHAQAGGYSGQYQQGGYSSSSSSSQSDTYRDNLENDYKILEVSPDATDEEVKKAYRAAAKKHHPDKVSHLGEDVRKAAEEKFAKVNQAYDRIKKARGMN